MRATSRGYRTVAGLVILGLGAGAGAREIPSIDSQKIAFDINAPSMVQALIQFTEQSGLQIAFPTTGADDLRAPPVVGEYTPRAALEQLLKDSGLRWEVANERTVSVRADGASTTSSPPPVSRIRLADTADKRSASSKETESEAVERSAERADSTSAVTSLKQSGQSEQGPKRVVPEILVKGSRVMNVDVVRSEDDPLPYTILTSEQIQQSGASNVEEFLKRSMTMNTVAWTNSQKYVSNSGSTSSINLRGLGPNETLVLVDGRRVAGVPIEGKIQQPDINGIPLSAVERIEVLPSSASAIYGGAAMGGVVNIVLKRRFDGGEVRYTFDDTTSGSAPIRTLSGSFGTSFLEGRTRIMVTGQYSDSDPLTLGERTNLFQRSIARILRNDPSFLYQPLLPFQGASTNIASATGSNLTLKDGSTIGSQITHIPAGAAPGSDISEGLLANAGTYDLDLSAGTGPYGLASYFGSVPRTWSVGVTLRQSLFERAQIFADVSTRTNASHTINNPFGVTFLVPEDAPTNPFQQAVRITFPSAVAAPLRTKSETRTATLGFIVPLALDWSAEIDYTRSRNSFEHDSSISIDTSAFNAALSAGTINPFVDVNAYPPDLTGFLNTITYRGTSMQSDVGLRVSGSFGAFGSSRTTVTIGAERRREWTGNANSEASLPFTTSANRRLIFFGQSQSIDSLYVEAGVPLITSRDHVPLIHSLDLQLAGRTERYTIHMGTPYAYLMPETLAAVLNPPQGVHETARYTATNPTIALRYQPSPSVTLRTSYTGAFLPPTTTQLLADPRLYCSGTPCRSIFDPKIGENYRVDSRGGGNRKLHPQTARTWNVGLVWTPQQAALKGLRVNLEHYEITQPNYIVDPLIQEVIDNEDTLPGRVVRDPSTGRIVLVDTSYLNATKYRTSGYDLKVDYDRVTRFGDLSAHLAGTLIGHDKRQYAIGSPFLEYAGFAEGEGKFRANATLSWGFRNWTVAWSTTYYPSYRLPYSPGSPSAFRSIVSGLYTDAQGSYAVASQTYHDLYVRYAFNVEEEGAAGKLLSNVTVQAGIGNVFNALPPLDVSFNPYFYSSYGDPRLRTYRLSVTKGF